MAGADDDIEKLLREVDSALGGARPARSGGAVQPASTSPAAPARGPAPGRQPLAAARRAAGIGAGWGVGVGAVFWVLPFVHSASGGLGAFVAAFSVSFVGRVRRR
jgi:hypothetical protein